MGRRAKGKQGAPEPLEPKVYSPSKLGKRKADTEEKAAPRPAKKVKDSDGKSKPKSSKKAKVSFATKGKTRKGKTADSDDADGWEDVDDLKAQTKCVTGPDSYMVDLMLCVDLCLMKATKKNLQATWMILTSLTSMFLFFTSIHTCN